jgi:hypothetical protein
MGFARPGLRNRRSRRIEKADSDDWSPRQAGQGTHDQGFAGPGRSESDPCSPFAGFRIGVCLFWAAWRTQNLDRLLGPGNGHNLGFRVDGWATSMGARSQDGWSSGTFPNDVDNGEGLGDLTRGLAVAKEDSSLLRPADDLIPG